MVTIKVTLRRKPTKDNMESLYFDFYPAFRNPDTGKLTRRQFLGIKIFGVLKTEEVTYKDKNDKSATKVVPVFHEHKKDEKGNPIQKKIILTELQKQHNKDQLQFAENIRLDRQRAVNANDFSFKSKKAIKTNFLAYFKDLAGQKNLSDMSVWNSAYNHLEAYCGGKLESKDITIEFVEDFKRYLENKKGLKTNTKASYFIKFKIAVKDADKKGFVKKGTYEEIKEINIKEVEPNVEFLTLEELGKLKNTPCPNELYKQAALFSAATGLRRSDVVSINWRQIKNSNDGLFIDFSQQKTSGLLHAPLNDTALQILGKRQAYEVQPFAELLQTNWAKQDKELHKWVKDAGISKKITFHCFRHSYAVALISKGTDIFTVSKMLGHKNVMSTVRSYAKVMNSDKQKAVNKINF